MRLILLLLLSVFTVPVEAQGNTASTPGPPPDRNVPDIFFPFGTEVGDSLVPVGDDVSSPAVNIPGGFPFLSSTYRTAFVSIIVHSLRASA